MMLSSSEAYIGGSSSSDSSIEQHSGLSRSLDAQNFPGFLVNSGADRLLPSPNMVAQGNANIDGLNYNEVKSENIVPWVEAAAVPDSSTSYPLQDLNLDLSLNHDEQAFANNVNVNVGHHNGIDLGLDIRPAGGNGSFPVRHTLCPDLSFGSNAASSSRTGAIQDEMLDGHRASGKRKSSEVSAETAASGSLSNLLPYGATFPSLSSTHSAMDLNMPGSSSQPISSHPAVEHHPGVASVSEFLRSDPSSYAGDVQSAESSCFIRNTRPRVNLNEHGSSHSYLIPEGGAAEHSNQHQQMTQQPLLIPVHPPQQPGMFNNSDAASTRHLVPVVARFSQNLHGLSLGVSGANVGDRAASMQAMRSFSRSLTDVLQMPSSQINAAPVPFSGALSAQAASGSGGSQNAGMQNQQMLALPQQNSSMSSRALSEIARRSLILSGGSSHSRQSSVPVQQHAGNPPLSVEVRSPQMGLVARATQRPNLRIPPPRLQQLQQRQRQQQFLQLQQQQLLLQQQQQQQQGAYLLDIQSFIQSLDAGRVGRSRVLSEIHNALDLLRQEERPSIEDLRLIDRQLLFRRANLHDRHRELRLDVDNMSYEELLELEERIGYVSTGLCEEKILGCLKQRKHVSLTTTPPTAIEPCCICQEEYVEGEEIGRLACGHDFHTCCIKKWLTVKNVCPICKKAACSS